MQFLSEKKGFSVIELIFAMFFLGVIVLGVVNLQSSNLSIMNRQGNEVQAHLLANEGMQIIRTFDYQKINDHKRDCDAAKLNPCIKYIGLNNLTDRPEEPIAKLFERSIEIKTHSELPNALEILVYIEWTDTTGDHRKWIKGKEVNGHIEAKSIIYQ